MRLLLISTFLICATTGRAGPPPDDSAETWVARADRDIAAVPDPHHAKFFGLSAKNLAVIAYDASPTDARRAAAVLRVREQLAADTDTSVSPVGDKYRVACAAADLAEVDDLDGARKMLEQGRLPQRNSAVQLRPDSPLEEATLLARAYALVRLGDIDRVPELPLGSYADLTAASYENRFRDDGRDELAETFRALVCQSGTGDGRWRELAERGFYTDAIAVTDLLRPKSAGPAYQMQIASIAAKAGHPEWKRAVARRILANLEGDPDREILSSTLALLEFCAIAEDRACVDEVGTFIEQHDIPFAAIKREAALASAYAAVGEMEKYRQHISVVAVLMKKELAGPPDSSALPYYPCVDAAAAYARAGDRDHAESLVDSASKIVDACGGRKEFTAVEFAFVRAGRFDDAVHVARLDPSAGSWRTPSRVAFEMARSGRFVDARAVAGTIEETHRPPVWSCIARQQVQQRQTDGLSDWVAALPTPQARAAVCLGIAFQISGRHNHLLESWLGRSWIDD
jgi:hypothetical protein